MNIKELQMKKVRLSNQLSDLDREKVEIQTTLIEVETEIELLTGPNSEQQIWEKRKEYNDYDTKDFTIECIDNELENEHILTLAYINWDSVKQSRFIESILLGLPIPILIMADYKDRLLVIDGNQRIATIEAFVTNHLKLSGLTVLDSLNGLYFKDLIPSRQRKFINNSIRVVIFSNLTDKVKKDLANRFDMNYKTSDELDSFQFQRLQTADGQWCKVPVKDSGV
jgi:Protein of unknown function DUF262